MHCAISQQTNSTSYTFHLLNYCLYVFRSQPVLSAHLLFFRKTAETIQKAMWDASKHRGRNSILSLLFYFILWIFFSRNFLFNLKSIFNIKPKKNKQYSIHNYNITHKKKQKNVQKNEQNSSVNWFVYVYISVCHHYHNCEKSLNKQFGQSLKSIGTIFGKCQFEMHHINSEISSVQ